MYFSIIIPVYNRPDEIKELLDSLLISDFSKPYEIVIVEDGSSIPCKEEIEHFKSSLHISYYYKENSGPGDSRNFGMKMAKGDYFIIFDSDCIIPSHYLSAVEKELTNNYVDCFGGSDAALDSFSSIQKAINFTMTSFLTTGGIRGGRGSIRHGRRNITFNGSRHDKHWPASSKAHLPAFYPPLTLLTVCVRNKFLGWQETVEVPGRSFGYTNKNGLRGRPSVFCVPLT